MRKIAALVLVFGIIFCSIETAAGGVDLRFDFEGVSELYVRFTNEFGAIFMPRAMAYPFVCDYGVEVREDIALIRYENKDSGQYRFERERAIAVFVNYEKIPLYWFGVKDIRGNNAAETAGLIKKKSKEFSDKIFQRLLLLEKEKQYGPKSK